MTEEIYIDGTLMDVDADKTNVQLIYQSPVLTDFQSVTSNRTTNVTLPLTQNNLRAIGYTGTSVQSDFAYRKHNVVYKRDGVQMFSGKATLTSIKATTISFCFTWGNVTSMETLFNTNLRDLDLGRCTYPPTTTANKLLLINYGGGRRGVGVSVASVINAIQTECGVSGLTDLCRVHESSTENSVFWLALTSRNGDITTREMQGVALGGLGAHTFNVTESIGLLGYTALTKGTGATDPHAMMNEYGCIDVSNTNTLRIVLKGSLHLSKPSSNVTNWNMYVYGIYSTGGYPAQIDKICDGTKSTGTLGRVEIDYAPNYDKTLDVSNYDSVYIMLIKDSVAYDATLSNVSMTDALIVTDPTETEDVMYDAEVGNNYPIALNLPDMSCGQFIKNLLWLRGSFAYTQDGRTLQIVTLNTIRESKARAVDWTEKMTTIVPSEIKTTIDTAQRNTFRYAEADWYDTKQHEGVLLTDDETLDAEKAYCECDFALCPDATIPVWTKDEDGEWSFSGDSAPAVLLLYKPLVLLNYIGFNVSLNWSNILKEWYGEYANIIRRPIALKAEFVLTTLDLLQLDMTRPVYLKQTGHYYLIRKLTAKSGNVCDVELIKI